MRSMRLRKLFLLFLLPLGIYAQQSNNVSSADDDVPLARIVGGTNAAVGQFPYQISLRERGFHICGGSIITQNYVVTAAHCVTTKTNGRLRTIRAADLSIRAGSVLVNSGGKVVGVSKVIPHPNYKGFANDIALLKLSSALLFNNQINSIPLATANVPEGASVVISGWGRLRTGGPSPNHLQYNTLSAISNAKCRREIGNAPESILCLAHRSGNGACQGDSGGPGIHNGRLVGVTNFVINRCGSSKPDGYAKVSYFHTWLKQNSDLN